jgi:hypothetical protein
MSSSRYRLSLFSFCFTACTNQPVCSHHARWEEAQ